MRSVCRVTNLLFSCVHFSLQPIYWTAFVYIYVSVMTLFITETIQFCAVFKTFIQSDILGFIWTISSMSVKTDIRVVSVLTLNPAWGSFIPVVLPLADGCYVLLRHHIEDARERGLPGSNLLRGSVMQQRVQSNSVKSLFLCTYLTVGFLLFYTTCFQ